MIVAVEFWPNRPRYKLCRLCGQPMKPKGVKKLPDEYDHASGCPYSNKDQRRWRAVPKPPKAP